MGTTAGAANCHNHVRRVHAKNTIMVRLDITVENRSPLSFTIQNRADNAKAAIGAGIFRSGVPAMAMRTLQLMPQVDAYGIERGIVGHFELHCVDCFCKEGWFIVPVEYDFSANQCSYAVDTSDARVLTRITYLGKSPAHDSAQRQGTHRLLLALLREGSVALRFESVERVISTRGL